MRKRKSSVPSSVPSSAETGADSPPSADPAVDLPPGFGGDGDQGDQPLAFDEAESGAPAAVGADQTDDDPNEVGIITEVMATDDLAADDEEGVDDEVTAVGEDVTAAGEEVTAVGEVVAAGEEVTAVGEVPVGHEDSPRGDDWSVTGDDDVPGEDDALGEAPGGVTAGADLPDEAGDEAALPTDEARLQSIVESLLFASDRPLSVADLKRLLGERDAKRITSVLEVLRERRADSGIQVVSAAGGWHLRTHPVNGTWVAKLVAGRPQRLSRAMMETLAIVAYRQPITRPEIDEIRGVDCGPVLRTLLDRALIRVIGKKEEVGRPILYGTTPEFLKTFSLRDLTELPTLRDFHELGVAERAEVDAATSGLGGPGADGAGAPPFEAGAPRPSTVELPTVDPDEEDALLEELDRATQVATRVTAAPVDPVVEDAPSAEEAGSAAGER